MTSSTNLQEQKRSNKKPVPGDLFTLRLPGDRYVFGRVIDAEIASGRAPMPGSYLIYLYAQIREQPTIEIEALRPPRLLMPPEFINLKLWTLGFAVTIAHVELDPSDLLSQHCFYDVLRNRYVDENGTTLAERHEPCGRWSLASYRKIDDLVSDRLGIPRVPIEPARDQSPSAPERN